MQLLRSAIVNISDGPVAGSSISSVRARIHFPKDTWCGSHLCPRLWTDHDNSAPAAPILDVRRDGSRPGRAGGTRDERCTRQARWLRAGRQAGAGARPSVRPSRVAVNSTGRAVNQSASPASARGGQAPGAGEVNGPSGLTTARWSVLSKSSAIFLLTDYHDASLHAMRKMRPVDSTYVQWSVRMLITTVSCAKTDEPIEMSFGVWSRGAQGTMY